MKTDYITSGSTLPSYMAYPRFLLGMNVRLTAKEIYAIMLDMTLNSEAAQTDKRWRRYLCKRQTFPPQENSKPGFHLA